MALLRDAKRCCVGAGAGEQAGLGDEDTVEEATTTTEAAEAEAERRALADAEGDGEAPRRGSGEEPAAALAATLVDLGCREGALPRGSGVKRAGAVAACASAAEGAATLTPKGIDLLPTLAATEGCGARTQKVFPFFLGSCWGCKARETRDQPVEQLARGKERADTERLLSRIRENL